MSRTSCRLLCVAVLGVAHLAGDGGAVLFRQNSGPFTITLFGSPAPLRTGPADLSVLVESLADHTPVLDAQVKLDLSSKTKLVAEATHGRATNKVLYAALPSLPEAGTWTAVVTVKRGMVAGQARGQFEVIPSAPAVFNYWPFFIAVPGAIAIFALNQHLKQREAARRFQ